MAEWLCLSSCGVFKVRCVRGEEISNDDVDLMRADKKVIFLSWHFELAKLRRLLW